MSYFDRTRKANPYHDSKGRFASANSGKSFSAGDYNDQYDDATVTDKSVFNKFSEEDKFRIKEIDKKVKTKPMTHTDAANYTGTFPDGEWSEARKAVHDKIISIYKLW